MNFHLENKLKMLRAFLFISIYCGFLLGYSLKSVVRLFIGVLEPLGHFSPSKVDLKFLCDGREGVRRISGPKHGATYQKSLTNPVLQEGKGWNVSFICVETTYLMVQNRHSQEQPQVQRTSPEDSVHSPLSHDIPGFPGPAGVILLSVPVLLCSTQIKFNDPLTSLYLSLTLFPPPPPSIRPRPRRSPAHHSPPPPPPAVLLR